MAEASFDGLRHLSDVVLVSSEGTEYPGHKVILSMRSCFFKVLFSSTSQTRLSFDDLNSSELEDLMRFMYGSSVTVLNAGNAKPLTEAARKYQMPQLLSASDKFCSLRVAGTLDNTSILDWLEFALEYQLPLFSGKCEAYVKSKTSETIRSLLAKVEEGSTVDKGFIHIVKIARDKLDEADIGRIMLKWMIGGARKGAWDSICKSCNTSNPEAKSRFEKASSWLNK